MSLMRQAYLYPRTAGRSPRADFTILSRSGLLARQPLCLRTDGALFTPRSILYAQRRHNSSSSSSAKEESFYSKLRASLKTTKIEWYPIPVGVGIGLLAFMQYGKVRDRERRKLQEANSGYNEDPDHKKNVRPTGPWQVRFLSTLPLKALSRLWGRFNEIDLPVFARPFGFKLYSWIFGVNIPEAKNQDLYSYRNLAEFFYREINPSVRPIDPKAAIVSPSDGKLLMVGEVREGGHVENIKGMTYSLDALLGGHKTPEQSANPASPAVLFRPEAETSDADSEKTPGGGEVVRDDEEFARVNGISYSLPDLFSGQQTTQHVPEPKPDDESVPEEAKSKSEIDLVKEIVGTKAANWFKKQGEGDKRLYFAVVYLAPGDYHRFHSPTEWVVETRRHFAGELLSVSPYLQAKLPTLFILNERVVLLGRWRHGFFSMTPVGATNVGSIVLNFDRELRTNSLTKDTRADSMEGDYAEATYKNSSKILEGHPLKRGEEMGGFRLGSTVVMVFEAPETKGEKGFRWIKDKGSKVKMGEPIGVVVE